MRLNCAVLLSLFFLSFNTTFCQSTTGNVEGWILDSAGVPVISANIIVTSNQLQGIRGTVTNARGFFSIQSLPVGTYTVKVSHVSFVPVIQKDITVALGQTTSLGEIELKKMIIETEEVTVIESRSVIDTRSAAIDKTLSSKEFNQLPVGRNYFKLAEILPNANQSFKGEGTNFAGGTGLENRYFIDGSEVTTPEQGNLIFELPYNFVRQLGVQTGSYQAEYQSALGGIINTVTYSGGNEFHGTIFGFFTNNNFSSSPRLTAGKRNDNYSNFDIGFGLGGPVVKDKLWYYVAYDPDFTSEDVYVNGLGIKNSHITKHKYAGKLTWNLDNDNLFTLAVSGNPFVAHVVNTSPDLVVLNPEANTYDQTYLISNFSLNSVNKLNNNFMLETSVSAVIMEKRNKSLPGTGSEPTFQDRVNGTLSGGMGITQRIHEQGVFNFSLKGTYNFKLHIIKAGIGFSRNSSMNDIKWKLIQRYPEYYMVVDQKTIGTVRSNNFSAFLQDSWQISQRLCLNAGVRWDPQWLIASDETTAQKILDQVQPRIGVVFQPAKPGTQKISASFGRFYQPLLLSLSSMYHMRGNLWTGTVYPQDPRIDTSGGVSFGNLTGFVTNVPDLKGQYYDEYTLGYERLISKDIKIGIRGIYRVLGEGVEDGVVSEQDQLKYNNSVMIYGNPGSGALSDFPEMKREYKAVELTLERFFPTGINFSVAYVLSRNSGNYDGFANTYDVAGGADPFPNNTNQFGLPERMINSDGLLPNDRTHVLKLFGSYIFNFGLTAGVIFQWMSGTPLNELGRDAIFGASTFLQPRGSAGRTPSIWDLSFRFQYDFSNLVPVGRATRLILDVLHVASQRKEIDYYQYHYYDYEQQYIDPNYMVPVQFQTPMSLRLGLEVTIN